MNRYISKSNYRWNMIYISFESELLKFDDSVLAAFYCPVQIATMASANK